MTKENHLSTDEQTKSSRFIRGLHRVFPNIESARAQREQAIQLRLEAQQAEVARREALSQPERILEDAFNAVKASAVTSMWAWKVGERKAGHYEPLGNLYPDSYPSYSRTTKRYLLKQGLGADNVLGHMTSPRFAFAIGLMKQEDFPVSAAMASGIFLVGQSTDLRLTSELTRLNGGYLDTLPQTDLDVLERAALDLRHASEVEPFLANADRHL